MARPFDAGRMELSGQPIPVAERVGHGSQGNGAFRFSPSGVLAYAGPILRDARLTWFDRDGKTLSAIASGGDFSDFRLSSDEKQLEAALLYPKTGNADAMADRYRARKHVALYLRADAIAERLPRLGRRTESGSPYRSVRTGFGGDSTRRAPAAGARKLASCRKRCSAPFSRKRTIPVHQTDPPDGGHLLFSILLSNRPKALAVLPLASSRRRLR